jgi:hypothetical protein
VSLCHQDGRVDSSTRHENSTLQEFLDHTGLSWGRYGLNSVAEFHFLNHHWQS